MKILKSKSNKHFFYAFTLAEVLITLGIIGIVAAMTIPTLIQNEQDKSTVVALKKAYSTMNNAYNLAVKDNGTPDEWGLSDQDPRGSAVIILNTFANYLRISKNCGSSSSCFENNTYRFLNGSSFSMDDANFAKSILADGSYLTVDFKSANCTQNRGSTKILSNVCATMGIDINGSKKPNQVGKDFFSFIISKYGIIPHGTQSDLFYPFSTCDSNHQGWGCGAWVLYNENMDYLHCNDLSWDGKHSCK